MTPALAALALVVASFAAPASALPCHDFTMTVAECTAPLRHRLEDFCVPDVIGC